MSKWITIYYLFKSRPQQTFIFLTLEYFYLLTVAQNQISIFLNHGLNL